MVKQPEIHGANTYDGTQMLMMAMEKACPNITGEAIAAAFHTIKDYKGLQGTFNVTPTGETLTKTLLGIIKGGKLTLYQAIGSVRPLEAAVPPPETIHNKPV